MKILVCIKQVPGTTNVKVDPVTGVLMRDGIETKMNPYDLYALEFGMRLATQWGGSVQVLTMGPLQAKAVLEEAVYMGADGGVLISDRKFAGSDVCATSYALYQGIEKLGCFDLILCGKQTTDGDTAQVGPELAEFMGIPHGTNILDVEEVGEGWITVRMNAEKHIQVQKMALPCLLTIEKDVNTPRLPSFKRKMSMEDEWFHSLALADFPDTNPAHYGLQGSPTQVERIFMPEKKGDRLLLEGAGEELAHQIYNILADSKLI